MRPFGLSILTVKVVVLMGLKPYIATAFAAFVSAR